MYNTAEYIAETLSSLTSSAVDAEIIIVDDGSTDSSCQVVEEYLKLKQPRAVLVRSSNGGPGHARNIGITISAGRYVTFFDSDDLCDPSVYISMLRHAESYKSDIVHASAVSFRSNTLSVHEFPDKYVLDEILNGRHFTYTTLQRQPRLLRLEASPVVRIYRRNFLLEHSIRFPEGFFFEDAPFHAQVISRACNISLINETLLYYRVNRPGQTTSMTGKRRFDMIKSIDATFSAIAPVSIPDDAGANLIGLLTRMASWCAEHCDFDDRKSFLEKTASAFSKFPPIWFSLYAERYAYTPYERSVCHAFAMKNVSALLELTDGTAPGRRLPFFPRILNSIRKRVRLYRERRHLARQRHH